MGVMVGYVAIFYKRKRISEKDNGLSRLPYAGVWEGSGRWNIGNHNPSPVKRERAAALNGQMR